MELEIINKKPIPIFVAATTSAKPLTNNNVSAYTAVLLIGVFAFYAAEGKRLQMKLWGVYFPLAFLISLAFSFGAFMFMRERTIHGD